MFSQASQGASRCVADSDSYWNSYSNTKYCIYIRIRVRGERRAIELAKKTIIYLNCGSSLYKVENYSGHTDYQILSLSNKCHEEKMETCFGKINLKY